MNEVMTAKTERSPHGAELERSDVDRVDEPEIETEAPAVAVGVAAAAVGVVRPVWTAPSSTYSHRPAMVEHSIFGKLRLPQAKARTAHVVVTRRRRAALLGTDGAPSWWELFWSRGTLYEVDLGLHHTSFEIELPSSDDTFAFRAEVSVEWRVACPVTAVCDGLADVREALKPLVRHRLCETTREHTVGNVIAAECAVTAELGAINKERPYGLDVVLGVRLSADTGAAEYAASRRDLEHKIRIVKLEQDVIDARMEHYRRIIDSGNVDQLALQLAHNPEGVDSIVELVRKDREGERRQVTEFLTQLLSSGAIDRWDVEDHVRTALEWLNESTTRTVQTGEAHIPRDRRRPNGLQNGHRIGEATM